MSRSYASSPPWRLHGSSGTALLFFPLNVGWVYNPVWMPTYVSILRIPQMIWVWRVKVEWHIDLGKLKKSEKNLSSQCHFVHHKSHMDWLRRESRPPRWEAGDYNLSHGKVTALIYFYNHAKFYVTKQLHLKWHGRSTSIQGVSVGLIESKYIVKVQFQYLNQTISAVKYFDLAKNQKISTVKY
jgi:hypothetical protein